MSENELELIGMIRACNDQKEALLIAIKIICDHIDQPVDTLTLSNKLAKINV